jgi:beta-mannosidase
MIDQQVSHVVKKYRNHPALVMWGGGNENVKKSGNDEGLFLVGRRCRQLDPSRPFHRTSPWGGGFHNWRVFHGGLPMDEGFMINPSVWYGEFGIPSMPDWNASLNFLPLKKMKKWPPALDDGGILMHMNQFMVGDMVKVMRYADYGPIDNWKKYIEYSQMAQGDELAFATRLQRAGSYDTKGGIWFYKMTELFPGQSWGVLDFYANPKLSYYRAKQLFAPRSAWLFAKSLEWAPGKRFSAELHAANDSGEVLEGATVELILYGSDLQPFFEKEYAIEKLGVSERAFLGRISVKLPVETARPFLAAVRLKDQRGNTLNDEWHWYNFKNKTAAVKKMESHKSWNWPNEHVELWDEVWDAYGGLPEKGLCYLPRTKLAAEVGQKNGRGEIVITNTGKVPAFNVIIDGFPFGYGAFLDANSFFLRPGETRVVVFELPGKKQLEGIKVRAWNAKAICA